MDGYNAGVDPVNYAARLLSAGPICDHCLGQQFAALGHGLTGADRGRLLRAQARHLLPHDVVGGSACWVCGDVFLRVEDWAASALEAVEEREFRTFLFGIHLSPRLEATQEHLSTTFPSPWAEPIRREINRCLGRAFEKLLAHQGRRATVDFARPDVRFTVELERGTVGLQVASVCFTGRYRKLVRGIPQTHWPCRSCGGRGCSGCNGTGKQYPESVEELVVPALVEACRGTGGHLHGAGREDVDARMLGRGRPFVVEILEPRRRTVELSEAAAAVERSAGGRVEVIDLAPADPDTIERIKNARTDKRYRMLVAFGSPVEEASLSQAIEGLLGPIEQRTPTRVRHRRADLVRPRRVHNAAGRTLSPTDAEIEILCEGGLYVKELISGDDGATQPSLSMLLGVPARVTELDVVEVLDNAVAEA